MTNKYLTAYLLLSIFLILSGIAWIVFSQVDSAKKPLITFPNLTREQQDIIRNIYQLPAEQEAQVISAIVVNPPSEPVTTVNTATQNMPVPNSAVDAKYDTPYYLRNNPWSPHYRPGN